jgi:hypothetical protein
MTNRELDALVAEKVMGWTWHDTMLCWYPSTPGATLNDTRSKQDWQPSTDISAAWEVVEKSTSFCEVSRWIDEATGKIEYVCGITIGHKPDPSGDQPSVAIADTAPRAICLAALKAVGVEVDG